MKHAKHVSTSSTPAPKARKAREHAKHVKHAKHIIKQTHHEMVFPEKFYLLEFIYFIQVEFGYKQF